MIQNIVVFLIVGLAVVYMARNLYRNFKGEQGCGCGCSGCVDTTAGKGHVEHESLQPEKDKET